MADRVRSAIKNPLFWSALLLLTGIGLLLWQSSYSPFSLRGDITAPTGFRATINGQNANGLTVNTTTPTVRFDWNGNEAGVSQYHIVLHDPQGVWPDGWLVGGNTSTLTVVPQGLQSGVKYGYSMRSKDTAGAWSNFVMGGEFTVSSSGPDTTPPSVPGNFRATINGQNANGLTVNTTTPTIQFTWDPASDPESGVKKYHIVLAINGVWVEGSRWFVQEPATSFSATPEVPLQNGVTYIYAIRAANKAVPEMWGAFVDGGKFTVNTTGGGDTTPPSKVENFMVKINGQDANGQNITTRTPNLQFSWSPASDPESGVKKYHIVLIHEGAWVEGSRWFVQEPATSFSATPEIPLEDGIYRYAIRAANKAVPEMWGDWTPQLEQGSFTVNPTQTCILNPRTDLVVQSFTADPTSNTARTTIKNNSALCTYKVALSAYEITVAWTGNNAAAYLAGQRHFQIAKDEQLGPGEQVTLNIAIPPNCQYQVDVFEYHGTNNPVLLPPDFGAHQDKFTMFDFIQNHTRPLCGTPEEAVAFEVVKMASPLQPADQEDVTYTITITNTGTANESVFLTDEMAAGTAGGTMGPITGETVVIWTNGTGVTSGTLASGRLTFDSFPAGATATLSYKRKANIAGMTAASSDFTNTAKLFLCE